MFIKSLVLWYLPNNAGVDLEINSSDGNEVSWYYNFWLDRLNESGYLMFLFHASAFNEKVASTLKVISQFVNDHQLQPRTMSDFLFSTQFPSSTAVESTTTTTSPLTSTITLPSGDDSTTPITGDVIQVSVQVHLIRLLILQAFLLVTLTIIVNELRVERRRRKT